MPFSRHPSPQRRVRAGQNVHGPSPAQTIAPKSAYPIMVHTREKGPAKRARAWPGPSCSMNSGDVLLSQGVSPQVPSALAGLTSVFGMGTGVTPPP
jgi:hypothetical protein